MVTETNNLQMELTSALAHEDDEALVELLSRVRAADLAEAFELLDDEARSRILFALPPAIAAEVVIMLDEAVRGDLVEDLETSDLTKIVSELAPDDAADVLSELDEGQAEEILAGLTQSQSDKIEGLMEFDESTAGGIMTPDVVSVSAQASVADAIEQIRRAVQTEDLTEIYIVDAEGRPVGTVPVHRLVTTAPGTKLSMIADPDVVTVKASDDQETVVQIIRKYDTVEAAVVDERGRLVGRITHDDLLDVAEEEAAEDLYRMAGTDAAELETSSALHAARIRLTWLLPCMFGMLLTATVLNLSRPGFDLAFFAALALFVPMIGAMGGNSGIQISTIIVRGFAIGDIGSMRFFRALMREGRISLVMAPVCGLTAWILVSVFFPIFQRMEVGHHQENDLADMAMMGTRVDQVALAVGCAMTMAILTAAALGIILPFTFKKLGVDPAIASGPLVTTTNDVVSVAIYMIIATIIAS
jgi:magnesium transporter